MYKYNICTEADIELFSKQCEALEKKIPGIKKGKLLQDVDLSLIQFYDYNGKEIRVDNDEDIGSLTITSEVDLDQFFN
ncbi:MAG: hypothetical protein ACOX7H_03235 [Bacillota bacterium]|jgi:hypothetical protein